jgi:hypothetical protein
MRRNIQHFVFLLAAFCLLPSVSNAACSVATSGGPWINTPFASQSGKFTAVFDATPSATVNAVVGLSQGAETSYAGFGVLVRFNASGQIDARNGGVYAADAVIPYSAGVTHRFRVVVDVGAHTYSAFVTPAGGIERSVAMNYAFRTEQATVSSLDSWGAFSATTPVGSVNVCDVVITPETAEPPPLRTFRETSLSGLQSRINSALPGDLIVLVNGSYSASTAINVTRAGTAANRIVIAADTVGGATISGSQGFNVSSPAAFVTIRGFRFTHAAGRMNVNFGAHHIRLTRNTFQNTGSGRYLTFSGDDGEIDHNSFQSKSTEGQMVSIRGSGSQMAQRVWIHHNIFRDFTAGTGNGFETLQLGLSGFSMSNAFTLVEHNLFIRTNGENEAISNKSSSNTFRYNTIRDTIGELTLRHGNSCLVHGNYFINSHGIRIYGDNHKIHSNYIEASAGINIGNGPVDIPPGPLTEHDSPDNVEISFNTLVNNNPNLRLEGRSGGLGATNTTIANNIIQSNSSTILTLNGPFPGARYEGNIVWGSAPNDDMPTSGARRVDPQLVRDSLLIFRPRSTSPAINTAVGTYSAVTTDMDGQTRVSPKDVGADEVTTGAIIARPLTTADVGPSAP